MPKIEYKITKDKGFVGQRCESYTIEKKIICANGETETRLRSFISFRDGDINKVNLDTLDFPKSITQNEWKQLSQEYHTAWLKGIMTKELCRELEELRQREGAA